jgi:glutamyl-tRNA reductase
MFTDLLLIHRPGGKAGATLADDLGQNLAEAPVWFTWQTCLRQIAVGDEHCFDHSDQNVALHDLDQVLRGEDAYRFLLEVICGLHSPLVGETEVYGQFKNKVAAFSFPETPFGTKLRRVFKALFEDAKAIRQQHLVDLGSQSYGSVLRRELKGFSKIQILGAGQLVVDILPWIAKNDCSISIFARDVAKATRALGGGLHIQSLTSSRQLPEHSEGQVLIIAAPVTNEFVQEWLAGANGVCRIIDLRADSSTCSLTVADGDLDMKIMKLDEVFSLISKNQVLISQRKSAALAAVESAIGERQTYVEYRPFGWEDVCA